MCGIRWMTVRVRSSVSDGLNRTLERCLVGRWRRESGVQKIGAG